MSKEVILRVLQRANEDGNFFGQLAQDYANALADYDLTPRERLAIGLGDVRWIESHAGIKIDPRIVERVMIPLLSREQW